MLLARDISFMYLCFFLLVLFALTSHIMTEFTIEKDLFFGDLINRSGKQRMLSQRLIIEASRYLSSTSKDQSEYKYYISMMSENEKSIEKMIFHDNSKKYYFGSPNLSLHVNSYLQLQKDMLDHPSKEIYVQIFNEGSLLLAELDKVVALHQMNYESELSLMQKAKLLETVLFILLLALLWRFFLRPSEKYFYESQNELKQYNSQLLETLNQQAAFIEAAKRYLTRSIKQPVMPIESKSGDNKSHSVEGINFTELYQLFQDDKKIERLLKLFTQTQKSFSKGIKEQEIASDTFKAMVHTLKGASGSITAIELYNLAEQIEIETDS